MPFELWVKRWTENSIGEQREGPWVFHGEFPTREAALREGERYPYQYYNHGTYPSGSWFEIRKKGD